LERGKRGTRNGTQQARDSEKGIVNERDRPRRRSLAERMTGMLTVGAATLAAVASPGAASAETCANPRPGLAANLPDCRSYEQVSPTEKGGYDAVSRPSSHQYPTQASPSGEAIAYMGSGPFAGALGSGVPDARVSARSASGWRTTDVTPPTPSATPAGGWVLGYDFSEELSQMVVKVPQQALAKLPAPGMEGLYNLFLRGLDGSYSLLNSAAPSVLPPPTCVESCLQQFDVPAFAGASSDFSRLLFEADDSLERTGAPVGLFGNLYEQEGGQLHLVGVLPDGKIAKGGATAGAGGKLVGGATYSSVGTRAWRDVKHAMSADGTHVLFEAAADGGPPDKAQKEMVEVYDRIEGRSTVEVSAPAASAKPANARAEPAQFWAASADGSTVFFTSSAELTAQSNTGVENNSQDLYRYDDVNGGSLTDLTVDGNLADATTGAGVQGVVGASSDGSYVYFVATGQLIANKGVDGQPNLYVSHEDGSTHERQLGFIATLAPAVVNAEGEEEPGDSKSWTATPAEQQAYVTPDGRHLALMSLNSLTGYDNIDQGTGKPDYEVYDYNAGSAAPTCASCDPSGARPVGSAFIGAALGHPASTPFHQPRVLSDGGGRLFFSSPDPLTARGARSHAKVYEYEQGGVGGCGAQGGCLYLLSGEASEADDVFLDASANGNDVFFATVSRLSSTDQDNLVDVYDARVGGGFPAEAVPTGCTSACQTSPGALAPPSLVSDLVGASGNLPPPSSSSGKSRPRVSCQSRARRIKNAKARARALKRCPKSRSRKASHTTARGSGKRPRSRR